MSENHISTTNKGLETALRPATDEDLPLILSAIMKSAVLKMPCKPGCICSLLPRKDMIGVAHAFLESILCDSRLVVASDPEDDYNIWSFGWEYQEKVFFIYTKELHRSQGLASLLLTIMFSGRPIEPYAIRTSAFQKLLESLNNRDER